MFHNVWVQNLLEKLLEQAIFVADYTFNEIVLPYFFDFSKFGPSGEYEPRIDWEYFGVQPTTGPATTNHSVSELAFLSMELGEDQIDGPRLGSVSSGTKPSKRSLVQTTVEPSVLLVSEDETSIRGSASDQIDGAALVLTGDVVSTTSCSLMFKNEKTLAEPSILVLTGEGARDPNRFRSESMSFSIGSEQKQTVESTLVSTVSETGTATFSFESVKDQEDEREFSVLSCSSPIMETTFCPMMVENVRTVAEPASLLVSTTEMSSLALLSKEPHFVRDKNWKQDDQTARLEYFAAETRRRLAMIEARTPVPYKVNRREIQTRRQNYAHELKCRSPN